MSHSVRKSNFVFRCTLIAGLLLSNILSAQSVVDCSDKVQLAKDYVYGTTAIIKDTPKALEIIEDCISDKNVDALLLASKIYLKSYDVPKDGVLAFNYMKQAADLGDAYAKCELGYMYKKGIGCKLNFDKAVEVFRESSELGNEKAAYALGFMYYKGLGSITQDYNTAISWFNKSSIPLARHFLGICNYFGYGMPVNKNRAIELWASSPGINSKCLLEHLGNNSDVFSLGVIKKESVKASELGSSSINDIITEPVMDSESQEEISLKRSDLIGDWEGKLIELDWSKSKMNRSFPFKVSFSKDKDINDLNYSINFGSTSTSGSGVHLDQSYYFNKLETQLPKLYQENRLKYHLDYKVISLEQIEVKEINNIRYLVANVTTQVLDWKEPGEPMVIVLSNTKALTDNGKEIDDDLLAALLADKQDNFITSYPNPFQKDLLIQFELEKQATTQVEIYNFGTQQLSIIAPEETKKAGDYLYHVDTSNYGIGLYVIRVIVNGKKYTKLIVKE